MGDDRIIGCLPGELPATFILISQEARHRRELAERDAEMERRCMNVEENARAALATALARAEAAERLAVWAVRHGASEGYDGNSDPCIWYSSVERHRDVLCSREEAIRHNATDADLLRALKEASGII